MSHFAATTPEAATAVARRLAATTGTPARASRSTTAAPIAAGDHHAVLRAAGEIPRQVLVEPGHQLLALLLRGSLLGQCPLQRVEQAVRRGAQQPGGRADQRAGLVVVVVRGLPDHGLD